MKENAAPLLTLAERREAGHARRAVIARSAHADWAPAQSRVDPVAQLKATEQGRIPALLPLRYGRMAVDPFCFLRGAAAIMAADLGANPNTGLRVQLGGDAHINNFGAIVGVTGDALFDANDFDETIPGPFEWDLKRLAASLAVAGRVHDLSDKACRALARRAAQSYRHEIATLASVAPFDAWRRRVTLEDAVEDIGEREVRRRERHRLREVLHSCQTGLRHLVAVNGKLQLPQRPPAIYRLGAHEHAAHAAFAAWEAGLTEERLALLRRYRLTDVAFKAVGVGSVGTFCALGLYATPDGDTLILQLKEAMQAALAPYAGASVYKHQGERVVVGQRLLQAEPDLFLGWTQSGEREFYVRRLKDPRLAAIGSDIEAGALPYTAKLCGRTLARAHARAGDAAMIAGYLGDGDSIDQALGHFAIGYADQTERDFGRFRAAIAAGEIEIVQEAK
jgi:uncharacterized protein (DUF2252 family)